MTFSPLRKSMNRGTTRTPHSFISARVSASWSPMILQNVTSVSSSESAAKCGYTTLHGPHVFVEI